MGVVISYFFLFIGGSSTCFPEQFFLYLSKHLQRMHFKKLIKSRASFPYTSVSIP